MPVFYLAYKRKPWIVKYREPWTNKPRVKSFGKDEEEKARAFERAQADLYEREREIIRRAKRRRAAQAPAGITVDDLLQRYMDTLSNPSTRAANDYHLRLFLSIYGHRKAHCISMEDVAAFLELQAKRGVGKSTACRRVGIVRTAYTWAVRWGLLSVNPLAGLQLSSPTPQTPDPPTAREARMLFATAAPHLQRVIAIGMATGARIGPSELFRLRWTDVDTRVAVLRMPNASKGAPLEAREVPLRSDLLRMLRQWEKEDAALGCPWVIHYKGRPVRSISRAWHNTLRRAGISRRIRPYDLRHAFASRSLDHGAELKCVAEIMGHANEKMIVRFYRHTNPRARRKAINAAPSLGLDKNMDPD
ncbi:hypothetical protein HMPREF0326_01510 [Desulfovibrio sp. 3_1_syn3]|uniref:tyrosine-type recombinase/integrase n=1 Tax=Desulfovibrio sp. 3_1_syn3 TaxID=457398 RepID=UPI0001E12A67|nr:site-specific integrase [Desulfovibrio sp. 3_1_syn3]EFL85807.1 hypothetical protein HMPREF0326_01510 [Desulfovibrio sp. 3_1_syn3]